MTEANPLDREGTPPSSPDFNAGDPLHVLDVPQTDAEAAEATDDNPEDYPLAVMLAGYCLAGLGCVLEVFDALRPGPALAAAMLIVPAPVLVLVLAFPGAYQFRPGGSSGGRHYINSLMLLPAVGLLMVHRYNDLGDRSWPLIPSAIVVVLAGLLAWSITARLKMDSPGMFAVLIVTYAAAYTYGAVEVADIQFDQSVATAMPTTVIAKMISLHVRGGHSYLLDLSPWGPKTIHGWVNVSPDVYYKAKVGQDICVNVRPGALQSAWFDVSPCTPYR